MASPPEFAHKFVTVKELVEEKYQLTVHTTTLLLFLPAFKAWLPLQDHASLIPLRLRNAVAETTALLESVRNAVAETTALLSVDWNTVALCFYYYLTFELGKFCVKLQSVEQGERSGGYAKSLSLYSCERPVVQGALIVCARIKGAHQAVTVLPAECLADMRKSLVAQVPFTVMELSSQNLGVGGEGIAGDWHIRVGLVLPQAAHPSQISPGRIDLVASVKSRGNAIPCECTTWLEIPSLLEHSTGSKVSASAWIVGHEPTTLPMPPDTDRDDGVKLRHDPLLDFTIEPRADTPQPLAQEPLAPRWRNFETYVEGRQRSEVLAGPLFTERLVTRVLYREDQEAEFKQHVAALCSMRGTPDCTAQNKVCNLALSGGGGSGKTEFLYHLQRTFDTELSSGVAATFWQDNRVDSAAVLFAGFNNTTTWNSETDRDIVKGTMTRLLWSSFVSDPSFADFRREITHVLPDDLTVFTAKIRNWIRSKSVNASTPLNRIAVVICIDELMKIGNKESHTALLDALATAQQQDLRNDFPTIVVVSSLRIFHVEKHWVTASQRPLRAIGLPPLREADEEEIKTKLLARCGLEDSNCNQFALYASFASAGGHPRLLEQVVVHLMANRRTGLHAPFTFQGPNVSVLESTQFEDVFTLLSAQLWGCNVLFAPSELEDARLLQLQERHHATESCFLSADTVHLIALRVLPWAVLNCDSKRYSSSRKAIVEMFDASHFFFKTWEKGLVACLHLKAQAVYCLQRIVRSESAFPPCQRSRLPFKGDEVVTLGRMLGKCQANEWPTLGLHELKLVEADEQECAFDVDPIHNADDLKNVLRSSNGPIAVSTETTQPRFEGFFRCYGSAEQLVLVFFQNKLRHKVTAKQITSWATDMHDFVRDTLKQPVGSYYVLIFCTLEASQKKPSGLPEGTIVVTKEGCEALLEPFHASRLVSLALAEQRGAAVDGRERSPPSRRPPRSEGGNASQAPRNKPGRRGAGAPGK